MTLGSKPHVAIFAFPFGTHAAPLLLFARKLASSAPDAAFSFFSTSKSNASLLSISSSSPLPNLKMYDVANGVPEGHLLSGNPMEEMQLFLSAAPGNFRKRLEAVTMEEEKKVTCVLSDSFLWFAGETAEKMGVPWLSLWTSGACSLSAHVSTDLIRRTIGTATEDVSAEAARSESDEALSFVPGFSDFRVRDLPEGIVFGPLDSPINKLLHQMALETPPASAVLINTFEGLDPTPVLHYLSTCFESCLPIGPISLLSPAPPAPDPDSCFPWLDARAHAPASVAYVAFGSVMAPPPPEIAALADGLEASGAHFLWSLNDKQRESLPPGFLERTAERGKLVHWAPQTKVLEHAAVGAFVTHCGWNSVLESIGGGVPMICRPFFGDQRLNGRLASHVLGIAVGLEGGVLTKQGVVDGLHLLLRSDEGKKMKQKVALLKSLSLDAVGETGSATKNLNTVLDIIKRS